MTNANNVLFIVLPSSFTAYAGSKLNAQNIKGNKISC
jgi:hypothetical protein